MTAADLFSLTAPPALPAATVEALREVEPEGKRLWVERVVLASVAKGGSLDDLRRSLRWERLDGDFIERLVQTLRDRGTAS